MSSGPSSRAFTVAASSAAITALVLTTAACGSSATKKAAPKPSVTSTSPTPSVSASPSPSASKAVATPSASRTSAAPRTTSPVVPTVPPSTTPATPPPTALVTVAPVPVRTQNPVAPQAPGNFGGGVTVKISKIASVKSAGTGPGEISGAPSVALTITMANGTAAPISLDSVAVTAVYGAAQTPASPSDGPPSAPFSGSVAAQRSANGTYVFTIPANDRGNVTISMSYTTSKPTVLFHGSVAG